MNVDMLYYYLRLVIISLEGSWIIIWMTPVAFAQTWSVLELASWRTWSEHLPLCYSAIRFYNPALRNEWCSTRSSGGRPSSEHGGTETIAGSLAGDYSLHLEFITSSFPSPHITLDVWRVYVVTFVLLSTTLRFPKTLLRLRSPNSSTEYEVFCIGFV